jgi:hypothetical protein
VFQAVKRAKSESAAVDPARVCSLASAVLCGLCDTAATGRWQQQHLEAARLLVSCVPAGAFSGVVPYCCKLVTLLAPHHAAAGSSLAAAAAASVAQVCEEESLSQLLATVKACVAAAVDGEFGCIVCFSNLTAAQAAICLVFCNRGLLCKKRIPVLLLHLQQRWLAGDVASLSLSLLETR